MKQYIDIVKKVLNEGEWKSPVRRDNDGNWTPVDGGVKTLACPNVVFSHDMSDGFPLLTTKKMAWKTLRVELEGFIKGITDKSWFQERNCKIWDEWSNPEEAKIFLSKMNAKDQIWSIEQDKLIDIENQEPKNFTIKDAQKETKDLGPIYGYQWRHFGQQYGPNCTEVVKGGFRYDGENGLNKGADQLKTIVETLRTNPMDRRMVCSAWNPNQIHMQALPPCHYSWGCTAIGDKLHFHWEQRSCDLMLGVPFNIASYALLHSLLAKEANLKPGNLTGLLVDCHIYENQIEAAKEQVKREPRDLPTLRIPPNNVPSVQESSFDIFKWDHTQVILNDYNPMDSIKFGDVVV